MHKKPSNDQCTDNLRAFQRLLSKCKTVEQVKLFRRIWCCEMDAYLPAKSIQRHTLEANIAQREAQLQMGMTRKRTNALLRAWKAASHIPVHYSAFQ